MDRKELERIAANPDFIPGIHNYCDRWCEKCPLSSRCTVFALAEHEAGGQESRDADNEAFWNRLREVFVTAKEIAKEWAEKNNIDISLPAREDAIARRAEADAQTRTHPLIAEAADYRKESHQWLLSMECVFKEQFAQAKTELMLELPERDPAATAEELADVIEIIGWYHALINVKLRRAVHQVIGQELTGEDDDIADAEGSAKVALMAMDRSLSAWAVMRNHLPDHEGSILDFLVRLDRLRRQTETLFPKARASKRPGFDDVNAC